MLRLILLLLISPPAYPRTVIIAPGGFYSNTWQQAQIMHLQTQQQLQAQDLYRRQLLMEDQQWRMDRLEDQRAEDNLRLNSLMMHQFSDRLKMYSRPVESRAKSAGKR